MNVLQYRWYYINGDDANYIIGDSAITLTVTSVLQYRLVITLSVLITLSVVTTVTVGLCICAHEPNAS